MIETIGYALIFWAVFMNAEDGFFGHYPRTPLGAVKWWFRNPCHNLCFHVIRWKGGPFWNGKYGYIGWRPDVGAFGMRPGKRWGS